MRDFILGEENPHPIAQGGYSTDISHDTPQNVSQSTSQKAASTVLNNSSVSDNMAEKLGNVIHKHCPWPAICAEKGCNSACTYEEPDSFWAGGCFP